MKKSFVLPALAGLLTATQTFAQQVNTISVTATVDPAVPSVKFAWDQQSQALNGDGPVSGGVQIYRRDYGAEGYLHPETIAEIDHFALLATVPYPTTEFIDTTVETGNAYEYRVRRPAFYSVTAGRFYDLRDVYIAITVDAALVDSRGTVLFVVDETLPAEMEQELQLAEMDMVGDGWSVKRITHEQHQGPGKSPSTGNFAHMDLKARIVEEYNAPGANLTALYLFGRLPFARSGAPNFSPDAHTPTSTAPQPWRAYETDGYYGDVHDGWTDTTTNYIPDNANWRTEAGTNVPGDGKFDQTMIPHQAELMTGRVDFGKMVRVRKNEREHLRDYIQKAHAWKHNIKTVPYRIHNAISNEDTCQGALQNQNHPMTAPFPLVRTSWESTIPTQPHIMASATNFQPEFTDERDHRVAFALSFGSYRHLWSDLDNKMRTTLAQPEWGITVCWGNRPTWLVHHMTAGSPAGYMWLRTINNYRNAREYLNIERTGVSGVHVNLLGDPTARFVTVPPPRKLIVSADGPAAILAWYAAPAAASLPAGGAPATSTLLGYRVYRSTERTGDYTRLTAAPITALTFTDATRPTDKDVYYQVRAVYLTKVPTGTYENQSQGIFNILRANGESNDTPVASEFAVTATTNAPAYLPFGGSGTPGTTLTPIVVKNPERGQVRWGGGKAHYVSNTGVTGSDSLTYRLWDGLLLSDPVTIPITVVAATHADSRLLLGWRFPSGDTATFTPASTYRKADAMLSSTLTVPATTAIATTATSGHVNKAFPVRGAGLADAELNENAYIAWTVAPAANTWQSLSHLAFFLFGGNRSGGNTADANPTDRFDIALRYSTDGFTTYETLEIEGLDSEGRFNAAGGERNGGVLCSADLRGQPALQDAAAPVQFRLYIWNLRNAANQYAGLGKSSETPVQSPFDLAVHGTASTVPPALVRKVAFDANGAATGYAPEPIKREIGADILLPGEGKLAKPHHKFAGWNTLPDGAGTNHAAGDAFTIPAENTTLYAQWKLSPYLLWVAKHRFEGPAAAPTAKLYADGITNLVKFALGLDPTQTTRYTDTGYFTTTTRQEGSGGSSGGSAKTLLVFTYAVDEEAETAVSVLPFFSKDLQMWEPAKRELLNTENDLKIYQAEGDFTDGKGFFRLEIQEK